MSMKSKKFGETSTNIVWDRARSRRRERVKEKIENNENLPSKLLIDGTISNYQLQR